MDANITEFKYKLRNVCDKCPKTCIKKIGDLIIVCSLSGNIRFRSKICILFSETQSIFVTGQ